jgi:hypothetical protein
VTLKPGTYLTGSLSQIGTTLQLDEGVTLVGPQKLDDYPMLFLADSSNLLWLNVGYPLLARLWEMLLVPGN